MPGAIGAGGTGSNPRESARRSAQAPSAAETERIIVTGSNIPTAQEVGPEPGSQHQP